MWQYNSYQFIMCYCNHVYIALVVVNHPPYPPACTNATSIIRASLIRTSWRPENTLPRMRRRSGEWSFVGVVTGWASELLVSSPDPTLEGGKGSGDSCRALSWFLQIQHSCFQVSQSNCSSTIFMWHCIWSHSNVVPCQLSWFITSQSECSSTILHSIA